MAAACSWSPRVAPLEPEGCPSSWPGDGFALVEPMVGRDGHGCPARRPPSSPRTPRIVASVERGRRSRRAEPTRETEPTVTMRVVPDSCGRPARQPRSTRSTPASVVLDDAGRPFGELSSRDPELGCHGEGPWPSHPLPRLLPRGTVALPIQRATDPRQEPSPSSPWAAPLRGKDRGHAWECPGRWPESRSASSQEAPGSARETWGSGAPPSSSHRMKPALRRRASRRTGRAPRARSTPSDPVPRSRQVQVLGPPDSRRPASSSGV